MADNAQATNGGSGGSLAGRMTFPASANAPTSWADDTPGALDRMLVPGALLMW